MISPEIFDEYYSVNILTGMTGVNRRPYRSRLREQRAEQTRTRILDAAQDLFLAYGYARATTAAIAARAGVSEAMLFAAFGTKAGVLETLIGRAVAGDQAPVALRDRPAWASLTAEQGARAAVSRFAQMSAAMQQRTWRLIELARAAADTDEAMASLLAQGAANRRADCRDFAEHAIAAALRPDLAPAEAADVLWLYSSADVYRMLVGTAGWTHERYAAWLAGTLARALLADPR
jgi:AcrR family transcriptional regulator